MLLYGFAVAHVQGYLLASPRLRDIQGGSQLLEDLCGKVFKQACEAAGLGQARFLSQAAGGARLESDAVAALSRLYAAWPMIAEAHAPGAFIQQALVDVDAVGGLAEAQRQLGERLQASRAAPACSLPAAGPVVARYARTGEPAEREQSVGDEWERIDLATDAKVRAWRELKTQATATLDQRFLGPELAERYRFAAGRESEAETLSSEDDPYVAVVHADGNSVGFFIDGLLKAARDRDSAVVFKLFSEALSQATREAANEAVREVLVRDFETGRKLAVQKLQRAATGEDLETLKARPIVLGGDDLTIILPARLAFDFTERFLAAFERTTREHLAAFGVPGFDDGLTASAGLALTKEKFPFDRAYELAESLCHQAKRHAKGAASASTLAFHRVTTSLPHDAATVLAQELTRGRHRLTFEAYRIGGRQGGKLADFGDLSRLAAALPNDQRGGFRGLLAELRRSPERAGEAFQRMCEIRRRRGAAGRPPRSPQGDGAVETERLLAALQRLNGERGLLWRYDPESDLLRTPLLDAFVVHRTAGTGGRA